MRWAWTLVLSCGCLCGCIEAYGPVGDDPPQPPERAAPIFPPPDRGPSADAVSALDAEPLDAAVLPDARPRPLDLGPPDAGPEVGRWGRCPPDVQGDACAVFAVPLDWDRPEGRRIDYFVRRFAAPDPPRRQVWLIQGGPGSPGDGLASYARAFQQRDPGTEVMVPDHRGTGRSSWLGCRDDLLVERDCQRRLLAEWGDDLRHFSATQAARDVGEVIERVRRPGQAVVVWGVSYGTVLVNRYAHLYPDQADALMYDSACPGEGCDLLDWDDNFDRIGRLYLRGCADDRVCGAQLGADPVGRLRRLYPRLRDGHCSRSGADPGMLKSTFAYLLFTDLMRPAIPALIARVERCSDRDREALGWFWDFLAMLLRREDVEPESGRSRAVYFNIVNSELYAPNGRTAEDLAEREASLLISSGGAVRALETIEAWQPPAYSVPAAWRRWAPTDRPLFILQGTLDPQTPHFPILDVDQIYRGPGQHVVLVPGSPHGAMLYGLDRGEPCALEMTQRFAADPGAPLADGCLARLGPPNYVLDRGLSEAMFGDPDAFGAQKAGRGVPVGQAVWLERARQAMRDVPPHLRWPR